MSRARSAAILCILAVHVPGCDGDLQPLWDGYVDTGGEGLRDTRSDVGNDGICDEQVIDIHHEIVRLMLLLDQSSSMTGDSWTQATDALQGLLVNPAFHDMHFGLDAFPDGYPDYWWDCGREIGCYPCPDDMCGTLALPQVAVAPRPDSASRIIAHMSDPQYPAFCGYTPLVNQMEYYAAGPGPTDAPEMYLDDGDNYLVVISDGQDEGCFSGEPVDALGGHATRLLDDHGIRSIAIGFGSTTGEMADELNAIASSGGSPFTTFLHAEDGAALEAALNEIAGVVNTCRYVIDDVAPSADPELVNFYIDGEIVPMDVDCTETEGSGWHWYDEEHTTVEFCGDYCTRIKDGDVESITATFGCDTFIM